MEQLVGLIAELKELVEKNGVLSISVSSDAVGPYLAVHAGNGCFDYHKDTYGWDTEVTEHSDAYTKEFLMVDGVEIFCLRPTVAKEAV